MSQEAGDEVPQLGKPDSTPTPTAPVASGADAVRDENTALSDETTEKAGDSSKINEDEPSSSPVTDEGEQTDQSPPSSTPPPPPASSSTSSNQPTKSVSSHTRSIQHNKLRAYESTRRSAYASKLHSSSLYWRSFRDLLHSSVDETERAELLVRATAVANKTYGEHMNAAHEGALDEEGNAVLDARKKKKLLQERARKRQQQQALSGGSGNGSGDGASGTTTPLHGSGSGGFKVSDRSFNEASERRSGILHSLIESHSVLADRYKENSKYITEELVPELKSLREHLVKEVEMMEKLGDSILEELEGAEKEVVDAWDAYYAMAVKSLAGGGANSLRSNQRVGASTDDVEITPIENCTDVWVVEMHYRMSVAFLSACWDKCSAELSKLFASMKETECSRRFRLREVLVTFLQRQERLWLSLPSIQTPVLKDLIDRQMDRNSIEEDVQTSIRLRAQVIQREEQVAEKNKKPQSPGPGLTGVSKADGNFTLSSPLVSDLLCKAKVIERRGTGMMSRWTTTLAVVTADSFLHLFDMPSSVRVTSGSAPEVAFHALVPPVEAPTLESIKGGMRVSAQQREWYEHLMPSESMVLPNCTISFQDDGRNSAFEITETVFTSGASKVFGKTTTKKLFLRTVAREETVAWIKALKSPK